MEIQVAAIFSSVSFLNNYLNFIILGEVPPLLPVKIAGMALDAVVSTLYPEDKHYQDMKENIARPFTPIITKSNHPLNYSMFKANLN